MKWLVRDLSTGRLFDVLLSKTPTRDNISMVLRNLGLLKLDTSIEIKYQNGKLAVFEFGEPEVSFTLYPVARGPYE